jgi:hypothetical protein
MSSAALVRVSSIVLLIVACLCEVRCTSGCGVADSVLILDHRDEIYLVYRVSGMHDKMEFFETYRGKPEFDSCGSTKAQVLAKEELLRSQGLLKRIEWREKRLRIVYTPHSSESIQPDEARLSP